jgi:ketosteroid isomerase-like protein
MSQENAELARRAHDAFNRRDLDAFLGFMDPEVELTTRLMELEGDPYYRGHDGVRDWWRDLLGIFPDFSTEVLDVREHGDAMVMTVRVRGHGLEGGTPFEEMLWQAGKMRDGKVTWWRNFTSKSEAFEAAGLSE